MARTTSGLSALLRAAEAGRRLDSGEALGVLPEAPAAELVAVAESLTRVGFGETVTIRAKSSFRSRNFAATFATTAPSQGAATPQSVYLTADEVLAIARAGKAHARSSSVFRFATSGKSASLQPAALPARAIASTSSAVR